MTLPAPDLLARWAAAPDAARLFVRANAVCVADKGVLILGASGSGKSTLSLALMAQGARLVCDDGVWLVPAPDGATLQRPETAPPLIEARGVGLLNAGPLQAEVKLHLIVDLDRPEPERLPPRRNVAFGNASVEVILGHGHPALAPVILQLLRHGRARL
jgi:HPr kinase/phosphorylase